MIDTHSHIYEPEFDTDREDVIRRAREAGVEQILLPNINAESIVPMLNLCHQHPGYCYPMLGLHPTEVEPANYRQTLSNMQEMLEKPNHPFIAIGEIGLDYYWDKTYKSQQQLAFQEQLHWATQMNLPVMIHAREATEDIINILKEHPGVQGVMHCFTGSYEVAKQYLDMGFYLGIGGVLTFKNCKLKQVLENIPLDRILLETDAPYMAPVPHRGKRNESRWMYYVAEMLATVYNVPIEEIFMQTENNSIQLFGLKL
jgi:TatD DNase family protein